MKYNNLKKGLETIIKTKADCCYSITEYDFPVLRAVNQGAKYLKFRWKKYKNYRSQDLKAFYHDACRFYWLKYNSFKKFKSLYPAKSVGIKIDKLFAQDIDDHSDFEIAKIKYRFLKNNI